jgi:hypothetical protein
MKEKSNNIFYSYEATNGDLIYYQMFLNNISMVLASTLGKYVAGTLLLRLIE